MPFTVAQRNTALSALAGAGAQLSLHTADPGVTGASEVTGTGYARVQTTWGSPSNGSVSGTAQTLTVPSGTTITHFGVWTAASGGTFLEGGTLQNSETYTGSGTYALTPTLTAS